MSFEMVVPLGSSRTTPANAAVLLPTVLHVTGPNLVYVGDRLGIVLLPVLCYVKTRLSAAYLGRSCG